MATLTGSTIADSYDQLLAMPAGGGNGATLVALTDGNAANTFALEVSTAGIKSTGTLEVTGITTATGGVVGDLTGNVAGDLTGNVTATSVLVDGVVGTTQSSGDNSTKVATTAYVDAEVATSDTLAEVLANGNTTGSTNIIVSASQSITTDTVSETTSAAGVTIDSVLVKDNTVTATTFTGALTGNVTGNVTGNLTGDVTGDVTGDLTGNADTVTTNANLTGGVTSVGNAATVITNANLTGGVTSVGNAATVITNANLTGEVTSVGNAATIADDVVDEANLKSDNSPTDDYVLTAKASASGGLTWAEASGGGTLTTKGDLEVYTTSQTRLGVGDDDYVLTADASAASGVAWKEAQGGTTAYYVQRFNGDTSTVAFTLAQTPASENNTQVFISGVYQQKDTYAVSGTTITFSSAPSTGTGNVEVVTAPTAAIGTTSTDLVTFTPAGTGATNRTAQAKLRDTVSVKDFGATGDGVTNDSSAVQAAIDSAVTLGRSVYMPSGSYFLSLVELKSGVDIHGDGESTKILLSGNDQKAFWTDEATDITISNLLCDGQKPTVGWETTNNYDFFCRIGESATGMVSNNITFRNLTLQNIGLDAIYLANCKNVRIEDSCRFINNRRWGVVIVAGSYGVDDITIGGYYDCDYGGGPSGKEYPLGAIDTEPNGAHPSAPITGIRYGNIYSNKGEVAILDTEFEVVESDMKNVHVKNEKVRVYNNSFSLSGVTLSGSDGELRIDNSDGIRTEISDIDVLFHTGKTPVLSSTGRANMFPADYIDDSVMNSTLTTSGTGASSGKVLRNIDGSDVFLREFTIGGATGSATIATTIDATITTGDQLFLFLEVERTDSNTATNNFLYVSLGPASNVISRLFMVPSGVSAVAVALNSAVTEVGPTLSVGLSGTPGVVTTCLIRKSFLFINPVHISNADLKVSKFSKSSSYTGTGTGFSSAPTGSVFYTRNGNIVELTIPSGTFTGTSSSTAFTITGGPVEIRPETSKVGLGRGVDSGAGLATPVSVEVGTNGTLTLSSDLVGGAWTAASTKAISNTTFSYNVQD